MKLIDADALIENYLNHCRTEFEIKNCCMANENVIAIIQDAPTVEPQKIVTIPPELIEKLASCVVDIVGHIDWEKAIEAYKARPQGEWISHIRSIECSVCKHEFFADDENENCQDYEPCTDFDFNFCPKCGADMRGKEND